MQKCFASTAIRTFAPTYFQAATHSLNVNTNHHSLIYLVTWLIPSVKVQERLYFIAFLFMGKRLICYFIRQQYFSFSPKMKSQGNRSWFLQEADALLASSRQYFLGL